MPNMIQKVNANNNIPEKSLVEEILQTSFVNIYLLDMKNFEFTKFFYQKIYMHVANKRFEFYY